MKQRAKEKNEKQEMKLFEKIVLNMQNIEYWKTKTKRN